MISLVRTLGKDGFRSNEHLRGDLIWEGGMRASGQVLLTDFYICFYKWKKAIGAVVLSSMVCSSNIQAQLHPSLV